MLQLLFLLIVFLVYEGYEARTVRPRYRQGWLNIQGWDRFIMKSVLYYFVGLGFCSSWPARFMS